MEEIFWILCQWIVGSILGVTLAYVLWNLVIERLLDRIFK